MVRKLVSTILGVAILAAIGAGAAWFLNQSPERDESGAITEAGDLSAFRIQVGDCLMDPGASFTEAAAVPCDQPHDMEAFHLFDLPDGAFPVSTVIDAAIEAQCQPVFEQFVGKPYDDSELYISSFTPTAATWATAGDREVVCLIVEGDGTQLTGSARGANR